MQTIPSARGYVHNQTERCLLLGSPRPGTSLPCPDRGRTRQPLHGRPRWVIHHRNPCIRFGLPQSKQLGCHSQQRAAVQHGSHACIEQSPMGTLGGGPGGRTDQPYHDKSAVNIAFQSYARRNRKALARRHRVRDHLAHDPAKVAREALQQRETRQWRTRAVPGKPYAGRRSELGSLTMVAQAGGFHRLNGIGLIRARRKMALRTTNRRSDGLLYDSCRGRPPVEYGPEDGASASKRRSHRIPFTGVTGALIRRYKRPPAATAKRASRRAIVLIVVSG
jgi:hypothetical protein